MSITDIGAESANDDSGSDYDDDGEFERFDVAGMTYVKNHPTTAVGGDVRLLRYFPGDPQEENSRGFGAAIIDNPFLYTEDDKLEHNVVLNQDESNEHRVVDLSDRGTKVLTPAGPKHWIDDQEDIDIELDEAMGIDFESNSMYGDIQTDFEEETLILKLTGNAGRSATCCLDVHGIGAADVKRDENGDVELNPDHGWPEYNGALIERWTGDDDDWQKPRFARDCQLRPDVEGKQIAFMLQRMDEIKDDYSGNSYWSTMLVRDDEDDEFEKLTPTDEFEADQNLLRATKYLDWTYPEDNEIAQLRAEQGLSGFDDRIPEVEAEQKDAPEAST